MPSPIPTESSKEKKERVRRNLRIIALCVACYYFISAGFTWYNDYQAEKTRLLPQVENVFVSDGDFTKALNAATKGSFDLSSDADAGKIVFEHENVGISKAVFEAKFSNGLSDTQKERARSYLMACENTFDEKTIKKLMDILCLNETDPQKIKSGLQAKSRHVGYLLNFKDETLSIEAVRLK